MSELARSVPQPEGQAVSDEGDIFVLSEPNLFYRFILNPPADWTKRWRPRPFKRSLKK